MLALIVIMIGSIWLYHDMIKFSERVKKEVSEYDR
jgi:hypothetical protein